MAPAVSMSPPAAATTSGEGLSRLLSAEGAVVVELRWQGGARESVIAHQHL
jgi:hypothetical protein